MGARLFPVIDQPMNALDRGLEFACLLAYSSTTAYAMLRGYVAMYEEVC